MTKKKFKLFECLFIRILIILCILILGAIGIPLGMLMRFIPVKERESDFFDHREDNREEMGKSKAVLLEKIFIKE